jgi:hypothetical protein
MAGLQVAPLEMAGPRAVLLATPVPAVKAATRVPLGKAGTPAAAEPVVFWVRPGRREAAAVEPAVCWARRARWEAAASWARPAPRVARPEELPVLRAARRPVRAAPEPPAR